MKRVSQRSLCVCALVYASCIWSFAQQPGAGLAGASPRSGNVVPGNGVSVVADGKFNAFGDICLTRDNRLIIAYRVGRRFIGTDGVIEQIVSTDFGKTWGAATAIYSDSTPLDSRDINLVQLSDGRLGISFFKGNGAAAHGSRGVFVMFSSDYGRTWGTPISVTTGFISTESGCSARIFERNDGVYLLPVYGLSTAAGQTKYSSALSISYDKGATWLPWVSVAGDGSTTEFTEHCLGYLSDGTTILDVIRCDSVRALYTSTSTDGGLTWSTPASTTLSSYYTSRPHWILLPSGGIVLNYRYNPSGSPAYATSWDNARTWTANVVAFAHGGFAEYGGLTLLSDTLIGAVFPFEPRGYYTHGEDGTRSDIYYETLAHGPPVQLVSVVSRKVHGSAGSFDIAVPLTGTRGVECRSGGANGEYMMIFTLANPLASVQSASISGGAALVNSSTIDSNDAHRYIVSLTGVGNAQYLTLALNNVIDSAGNSSSSVSATMGVLIGDVNASGVVTSGDTNLCKAQALKPVTNANFRNDINASGAITSGDANLIKQYALTSLPENP